MCGTLLFLCFRNLILVRISAYAATQIWLGAMSFSVACSWNDGTFHRTSNTFTKTLEEYSKISEGVKRRTEAVSTLLLQIAWQFSFNFEIYPLKM